MDQILAEILSAFQYFTLCLNSSGIASFFNELRRSVTGINFDEVQSLLSSSATAFALIVVAEVGDKSQLVCMAMAAKHRPFPVLLGAFSAFALLNLLAVLFGATVAKWFPAYVIALAVAVLFMIFGIQALMTQVDEEEEQVIEKTGHSIFFSTFLLITVAEFGDKTQLAVVALSSTNNAVGIWLGATLGLGFTSAIGVMAGRKLVQKFPLELLHKISGMFFLGLAVVAIVKAFGSLPA